MYKSCRSPAEIRVANKKYYQHSRRLVWNSKLGFAIIHLNKYGEGA